MTQELRVSNVSALERFGQTSDANISNLIWIAGSWETHDNIEEFMRDVDDDFYKDYMPEIYNSEHFESYKSEPFEALIDFQKFGLLAEINLPKIERVNVADGKVTSWGINSSEQEFHFVYAETLEELLVITEKLADERRNKAFEDALKINSQKHFESSK